MTDAARHSEVPLGVSVVLVAGLLLGVGSHVRQPDRVGQVTAAHTPVVVVDAAPRDAFAAVWLQNDTVIMRPAWGRMILAPRVTAVGIYAPSAYTGESWCSISVDGVEVSRESAGGGGVAACLWLPGP